MPELIVDHGMDKNIDFIFDTPYKSFSGIVEEEIPYVQIFKITQKGVKLLLTIPMEIKVESSENEWEMIREGTL